MPAHKIRICENRDCRRLITAIAVSAACFLIFISIFSLVQCRRLEAALTVRECSVAGRLLKTLPGTEANTITAAFTGNIDKTDTTAGAAALAEAGYNSNTIVYLFPGGESSAVRSAAVNSIAALLLAVCLISASIIVLRHIYLQLENVYLAATSFGRGSLRTKLPENAEGAFARLFHAFNEMSSSIDTGFEKLGHECTFFKELLSDVSHQLKTPLTALKMYNEIILDEDVNGTVRSFTEKSQTQLDRMEWLILGLLKMARLEADCLKMDIQSNDVSDLLAQLTDSYSTTASEKGVSIVLNSREHALVRCDAGWMMEAVSNVMKNCLEHTPAGGTVTVQAEETPVMVCIRISDTGPGIAAEEFQNRRGKAGTARCEG